MADLTLQELSWNEGTDLTATDASATQTIVASKDEKLILLVDNQDATYDATITISAGDMWAESQGDLEVVVGNASAAVIGPLESARFKDEDGDINVAAAIASGGTLTDVKLYAILLP
jgi:hypothetical protein